MPSIQEGISNAVLEAMSMEVPIITTDAGGMNEAVTNEVEGFVIKKFDIDSIYSKTEKLILDPKLRLKMGRNGRKKIIKKFTISRQIRLFAQHYNDLLEQ